MMARPKKSPRGLKDGSEVPGVYRDMLADANTSSPSKTDDEGKTIKKRRIGGRVVTQVQEDEEQNYLGSPEQNPAAHESELEDLFNEPATDLPPTVESDSESSVASNEDWEEVDLALPIVDEQGSKTEHGEPKSLDLVLDPNKKQPEPGQKVRKRKPNTAFERKLRLEIHKMHVCCLLTHVFIRSHWCNDEEVQLNLRKNLSSKIISYLNPDEDKTQFQRSRSFMDGLEQACALFRGRFKKDSKGMCRAKWAENAQQLSNTRLPRDSELPLQMTDFQFAAKSLEGSRDTGAQLFCAMLRSAGVEARLVCSLQCLPFRSTISSTAQPTKYAAMYSANGQRLATGSEDGGAEEDSNSLQLDPEGDQSAISGQEVSNGLEGPRTARESKFPVFWVEAFNEAVQKWVPVDPLVTDTIAKPSKLEPPLGDLGCSMSYVIAFEDDGSARDVTRRYAKAYNAKTRRDRVEATKAGQKWWKKIMRMFKRHYKFDRDQVEDAELASKEAAEPMPKNVEDFKNHPYYALERHLKANEVFHPRREAGKLRTSKGSSKVDPIFRRNDVQLVRSADKWYRMGREVKSGEQPLKHAPARRTRNDVLKETSSDVQDEEAPGVGLYASFQTKVYKALPVVDGRIPKNAYGNLDIYVPSMVPAGGYHIDHPETSRAAKILGIDYADAVTGFVFRGPNGSTVIKGAVVAVEYREAIGEVLKAFDDERIQLEEDRVRTEVFRLWKRFLVGLRIRERIEGYEIEGERNVSPTGGSPEHSNEDEGGGFLAEQDEEMIAEPTAGRAFEAMDLDEGGGFMEEEVDDPESRQPQQRDRFLDSVEDDSGGGFLVDDEQSEETSPRPAEVASSQAQIQQPQTTAQPLLFTIDPASTKPRPPKSRILPVQPPRSPSQENPSPKIPPAKSSSRITPDPYSSLTSAELAEARLLQQLHESRSVQTEAPSPAPTIKQAEQEPDPHPRHPSQPPATTEAAVEPVTVPTVDETTENAVDDNEMETEAKDEQEKEEEEREKVEEEEEDKGSLLSEDPEDEDAEPDWLV